MADDLEEGSGVPGSDSLGVFELGGVELDELPGVLGLCGLGGFELGGWGAGDFIDAPAPLVVHGSSYVRQIPKRRRKLHYHGTIGINLVLSGSYTVKNDITLRLRMSAKCELSQMRDLTASGRCGVALKATASRSVIRGDLEDLYVMELDELSAAQLLGHRAREAERAGV